MNKQADPDGLEQFVKFMRRVAETGDMSQRFSGGEAVLEGDLEQLGRMLNSLMISLETKANRQQADQLMLMARLEVYEDAKANGQPAQELQISDLQAHHLAHDFNNIFQAVIGFSELALRHLEPDHEARPFIEEVLKTSSDASDFTRRLLRQGDSGEP